MSPEQRYGLPGRDVEVSSDLVERQRPVNPASVVGFVGNDSP